MEKKIVKIDLTPATKVQLDEDLMLAISRLILLTSNVKKFLKTCPSSELVSEKYGKRKIKVEDTLAEINKLYGWG